MLPALLARLAAGAVLLWMVLLQFVLTPNVQAPWALFAVFAVGWAAALGFLLWRPRPGGAFVALLGVASAFGALRTHAVTWENGTLAALSVLAGLAGVWVTARR